MKMLAPFFYFFFLSCSFSVTQNPIYFPNISRVCASRAGIDPKKIIVNGKKIHSKNIKNLCRAFAFPVCAAIKILLTVAETISPIIDRFISVRVVCGKL